MDNTFFPITGNDTGNACIGRRCSFRQHTTKIVPSLGFDDQMCIHPCCKAWTQCNDRFCHIHGRSQILFCQNGIHKHLRLDFLQNFAIRVNEHRDFSILQNFLGFRKIRCPNGSYPLHCPFAFIYSFGKSYIPPNSRRIGSFQHNDWKTRLIQFMDGTCCQVADRHFLWFMLGVPIVLCLIGYFVTRTLGQNMARLRSFSEAIDRGENVIDPPTFPNDELGEISKHLVGLYLRLRQANADIEREHAAALHEQQEKVRIKRQLTNNINHELKTPVSSIKGYLETIIATPDMDETVRNAFITKSYAQTERLQQLISDISTITRLDEASEKIECCDVVLNRIIDEIAAEIPLKSKELQMRIKCNFGHDLHIEGNADMLASIFRNLTDNAVSYSGGRDIFITLLAENDDNYLFSFADNGIGVEEKHLPHLFERFYRVDKGRSRKMGGTGLGLSIVKNAVIFHGGTIEVRNRPEGGLEFLFSLAKKRRKKEQERTLTNT